MRALVFPGQGSQYKGMGADIINKAEVRELFDEASSLLGYDMTELCLSDGEDKLRDTRYCQPAIFTVSAAMWAMEDREDTDIAAGHSLGEYSALCAAGSFSFSEGLTIVAARGGFMAEAATKAGGAMYAVLGASETGLETAVKELSERGPTYIANENAPGQTVVSTSITDDGLVQEVFKRNGAKKTIRLAVSGAFHSPLMQEAETGFAGFLEGRDIGRPRFMVLSNYDALPFGDGGDIRSKLAGQLTRRVRWSAVMAAMAEDGVDDIREIGPGKVLQGLAARNLPGIAVSGTDV